MGKKNIRAAFYRGFQSQIVKPALLPWIFSRARERSRILSELLDSPQAAEKHSPIGWFHASSVGELEMLTPLIQKWARLVSPSGERVGVVVTIFSESAERSLERVSEELRVLGARLLFAGYAPWEGEWSAVLKSVRPEFFVTARYEAWPELWMSLSEERIPLLIAGASARSSLEWARRVCVWAGIAPPEIRFCTVGEEDVAGLRSLFPGADVSVSGDPRWERVMERAQRGNARAKEITEQAKSFPRPWGVLGSFWADDLKIWDRPFRERAWKGTLWVVPHKTDEAHIRELEEIFKKAGLSYQKSSEFPQSRDHSGHHSIRATDCILVNEMGFLAELYSVADWSYVGGGFGQGVHSTIEPAIQAIPVGCGPGRTEKFPEVALLARAGVLSVLRTEDELSAWLSGLESNADQKPRWKALVESQMGASERLLEQLLPWVSVWKLQKGRDSFSGKG